ncbi:MAG: 2-amino-4-hydroxy-6-hydroxymethyldihydropteridine diphosphokinase [Terracidiphilus sp.]
MRTAYIGMGCNLASWAGGPEATLTAAALRLESLGRVVGRSSLYSTAPVGFAAQPRFVNAVVELETELEPRKLLEGLLAIEREFGRDRAAGFANGPRTLDLDILLFGDLEISQPGLEIPHPRLAERAFVLVPLNEIAAGVLVPGCRETVAQLMDSQVSKARPGAPGSKSEADAVVRVQSDGWDDR